MTCLNHASLAASLAALTVTADAAAASKPKSPAGKRPDVIVIMTDQQTAGAMSCAGNPWVRTPAMDALAADGVRFTRAYCPYPLSGPCRAALVTGRMPFEVGAFDNAIRPADADMQAGIGLRLAEAGYECLYAGKWHVPEVNLPDSGTGFRRISKMNDPALAERGFYAHGRYPFVFDALFMEEDSPAGFGYIDVMKECQTAIDKMNHAMDENVLLSSRQRYVLSDTAGVNEEELTDLSRDIIHVVGRLNDDSFRPLQTAGLQGNSLSYRNSRIEELKEISGNRDMTQGGTAGGVTAASAIAALQEAGSKLSRDMLKSAYRAFAKECYLIIELMRQFYDEERIFRITGKSGESEFVRFSGQRLRAQPARVVGGVELGSHEPVFDIVVSAEKKSTFSRLSQNETAKECYQLGFFAPANADAALAALEMMDFEGIEKVRQRVRQNGTLAQQLAQMQARMTQLTGLLEVQKKSEAPRLSGPAQELSTAAMARAMKTQKGEMR